MDLDEEVREFLIESNENLGNLDREIVLLEQHPQDPALVASVFRTIHTVKGTCGFFGFTILSAISHVAENILHQVRAGQRDMTPHLISLILEAVDAIKAILSRIEIDGTEGTNEYMGIREKLIAAHGNIEAAAPPAEVVSLAEVPEAANLDAEAANENARPALISQADAAVTVPRGELTADTGKVAAAMIAAAAPIQNHGDGKRLGQTPVDQLEASRPAIATPEPSPLSGPSAAKNSVLVDSTIRVDVGLLDKLMNLVGELVLARNQLIQGTSGQEGPLIRTVQRLNLITSELQEGVLKTRMQPIGVVWNKLPRVIRDLAAECGKKIHIEMEGAETELDKTIIEAIKDPLTHIVRNSCDHGIELPELRVQKGKPAQGLVLLRAYHEGGHVNIEISDDGAGLNAEKLKARAVQKGLIRADQAAVMTEHDAIHLVFLPGFSTAETITNISGRGVGMDVVKTNIQKIGGIVVISNRVGSAGSTVKIKIPLTLAIIPGLIIKAIGESSETGETLPLEHRFIIPQANLLELLRLEGEGVKRIEYINGTPVYRRRGHLLPLAYLNKVLGMEGPSFPDSDVINIVVLQAEDRPFGLMVDGISDTQEIVVKPLGERLKGLSSYLGSTIMGDGRVALILDVPGLARLAGIASQARESKRQDSQGTESQNQIPQTFLVFQAGRFQRLAVPLALVARLEQLPRDSVQLASGRPVLHYREQILPLLTLSTLLDPGGVGSASAGATLQVIVFGEGARRVGVVVDEIVEIIEETVTFTQSSTFVGLLGSAVIGGKITDLIDLQGLMELSGEVSMNRSAHAKAPGRLLIVEASTIDRSMQRNYLEMRGYQILEAASVEGAMELLQSARVDLVVTALDLGSKTGFHLLAEIRAMQNLATLPVVATITQDAAIPMSLVSAASAGALQFDAMEPVQDRLSLLKVIQTIIAGQPRPVKA